MTWPRQHVTLRTSKLVAFCLDFRAVPAVFATNLCGKFRRTCLIDPAPYFRNACASRDGIPRNSASRAPRSFNALHKCKKELPSQARSMTYFLVRHIRFIFRVPRMKKHVLARLSHSLIQGHIHLLQAAVRSFKDNFAGLETRFNAQ